MKRIIIPALAIFAIANCSSAQSVIDALQVTPDGQRGTARFTAMGGAFTALGGDISTLNQNPAGIGIYRKSEIAATIDLDIHGSTSKAQGYSLSDSQTKFYCDNFGYIGSVPMSGVMKYISWGASYNRLASFDRVGRGYLPTASTSLTNYIANISRGYAPSDLDFAKGYNPYTDSDCYWRSILAYNSYLINPNGNNTYQGLYNSSTVSDAAYSIRERGYVDEYSLSIGGNINNTVYWGFAVGITDMNYTRQVVYDESLANATIYDYNTSGTTIGDAGYYLDNYKNINGSGVNLKLGVIIKPINELRIGLAVHTPTWYKMSSAIGASVDYSYFNPNQSQGDKNPLKGYEYTGTDINNYAEYNWKYDSPWKMMVGIAGVIGNNAIISVDYEYDAYPAMRIKTPVNYNGWLDSYQEDQYLKEDIKNYTNVKNTLRLGAEYRVTPQFSVRAGYNYSTSSVKNEARNGALEIFTAGTDPSYQFENNMQSISAGLGYRVKAWSFDLAYVHKTRNGQFHAFTDYDNVSAPKFDVTDKANSIVFTLGFRF